jgi:hypothetical protein
MNLTNNMLLGQKQVATDPLTQLGDALVIDPELLKLNESEFKAMLEGMSEEQKAQLKDQILQSQSALNKMEGPKPAMEIPEQPKQANPELNEILGKKVDSEVAATPEKTHKSIFVNKRPELTEALSKNATDKQTLKIGDSAQKTAKPVDVNMLGKTPVVKDEHGRINYAADRKSIFDINKNQQNSKNVLPQVSNDEEVQLRNLKMAARQPKVLGNNAYKQGEQKSLFAKSNVVEMPVNKEVVKPTDFTTTLKKNTLEHNVTQLVNPMNMEAGQSGQDQSQMQMNTKTPVFQMDQLKSSNVDQIIGKIQDYIVQAKAANEPEVQLNVNHSDLGQLDILVRKEARGEMVSIRIATHTAEGAQFFQQQQTNLLHTLAQSGVQVSDFKMDTASNMNQNNQSFEGHMSQSEGRQSQQEQGQRREDSQRRDHLWKMAEEQMKEAA